MNLEDQLSRLRCRIIDAEEARTASHRDVLLVMAQTFDRDGVVLLCEPSVVRGHSRPPDIAVIDPASGLHVVEVKGVTLDRVLSVQPGGAIEIEYDSNRSRKDPSKQAKQAMFDIKDAATRHFGGDLNIAFQSWVAFPRIRRDEWEEKFGDAVPNREDVLFADDLESSSLGERLTQAGAERLGYFGLLTCPPQQLRSVLAAFGDSAVLSPPPRPKARPPEGSKGEQLSDAMAEYRVLTEQQQRLAAQGWNDGPRLVRGVAGSGKTVVLATQAARLLERRVKASGHLFDKNHKPQPLLVVCFNRTLVPFIQERVAAAYRQRTGEELPANQLLVKHLNALLYDLHHHGFCGYYRIGDIRDPAERASRYLRDLDAATGAQAQRLTDGLFYAVFVDEGQDFHENDYRILLKLTARTPAGLPRMFVFYDDAQNLYGQPRPTWSDLGLEIRGRSVVMDESFRSTRQLIEPAFNVLLGTHSADPQSVRTRSFADIQTLKDKNLVSWHDGHICVQFAPREGDPVDFASYANERDEFEAVTKRCEQLIAIEGLLPQDILVLTFQRERARRLGRSITDRLGDIAIRYAFEEAEKDRMAIQPEQLTVSTVASAKGYDAPAVILAGGDDFPDDIEGRASFYVGFTRAREWLYCTCAGKSPLMTELERALDAINGRK